MTRLPMLVVLAALLVALPAPAAAQPALATRSSSPPWRAGGRSSGGRVLPARLRAGIERDRRALQQPVIRNLRRRPVVGETPVAAGASDAALIRLHRAETARLRAWLTTRASWLTATLPRIRTAR